MAGSITFKLGDREFTALPLTLGQYEDLSMAFWFSGDGDAAPTSEEKFRLSYCRRYGVILAAIRKNHPEVTEADLRDIPGATVDQLNNAEAECLKLAGLLKEKEPASGEAGPAVREAAE